MERELHLPKSMTLILSASQEPTPEALCWMNLVNLTWPQRNAVETQWASLTYPHSLVSSPELVFKSNQTSPAQNRM